MKTAYVSFHVHNYGIGFTKNILGAFFTGKLSWDNLLTGQLKQDELEKSFQYDQYDHQICFDKVVYLHVNQDTVNKITSTRRMKQTDCLQRIMQDHDMKKESEYWKKVFDDRNFNLKNNELESELSKVQEFPLAAKSKMLSAYWRIIHYYNIDDQKLWFYKYSNSKKIYNDPRFEFVNLEERYQLNDLHDYQKVCKAIENFLQESNLVNNYDKIIVNISGVGYEVQVAWFILAQTGRLNEKVNFISTYDNKDQEIRFKDFTIKEIPKNILEDLADKIKVKDSYTKSAIRTLAEKQFRLYYNKGFSILILGERGCGKTRLIQSNTNVIESKFQSISAAAFDDDAKLEAELFGYEKGAFTGANSTTHGLFHIVDNEGILFIDELHSMSNRVQEKLMSALSTDDKGFFQFRKLGGKKIEKAKFTIVFASNKTIDELKYKHLLPDFFDRVVQYTIYIPPLREAREDIVEDWKATWRHQRFNTRTKCPDSKQLFDWLRTLEFPGNWRDLQRIAIWYEAFLIFQKEEIEVTGFSSPLEYVQFQYNSICLRKDVISQKYEFEFSSEISATGQVENYKKMLAFWAKEMFGGSFKKAADHFVRYTGDKIVEKTLYNWAFPEKKGKLKQN